MFAFYSWLPYLYAIVKPKFLAMTNKEIEFKEMLTDYMQAMSKEIESKINDAVLAAEVNDSWNEHRKMLLIRSAAVALFDSQLDQITGGMFTLKIKADAYFIYQKIR